MDILLIPVTMEQVACYLEREVRTTTSQNIITETITPFVVLANPIVECGTVTKESMLSAEKYGQQRNDIQEQTEIFISHQI